MENLLESHLYPWSQGDLWAVIRLRPGSLHLINNEKPLVRRLYETLNETLLFVIDSENSNHLIQKLDRKAIRPQRSMESVFQISKHRKWHSIRRCFIFDDFLSRKKAINHFLHARETLLKTLLATLFTKILHFTTRMEPRGAKWNCRPWGHDIESTGNTDRKKRSK